MDNCPYCQCKMKKGAIEGDGRKSLIWVEENKERNLLSILFNKDCIILSRAGFIYNTSVKSSYCENCKKIIIDVK